MTARLLLDLMLQTIRQPREGAEAVLAMGIPQKALWDLLFLVVAVSVILGHVTNLMIAARSGIPTEGIMFNPFALGLVQLGLLLALIFGTFYFGRMFGGSGSLQETVLLITWLQAIMVALQVVQTVFLVLVPPIAGLIGIAGLLLFMWLLTYFVSVLHGFQSLARVFFTLVAGFFGFAVVLSIVLSIFGVNLTGAV